MSQFYDSLKRFVSPGMMTNAARVVEEKEANISNAVSSIFASLLGVFAKDGTTPQIKNILTEAGNLDLLGNLEPLCQENPTVDQRRIGDSFLQSLLGDRAADFTAPIAKQAGISKVATNRLVSMLAPIFAGYFGKKVAKDGWSIRKIQDEIKNQKNTFIGMIPAELMSTFGLKDTLNAPSNEPVKKKNGWVTWLIIIILLILIIILWRSCRNRNTDTVANQRTMVTDTVRQARDNTRTMTSTASYSESQGTNTSNETRATTTMTLADGTTIHVYRNGTEQNILNFINSNDFKNASDKDLQNRWFEFDNIAFEFGSGTELKSGSRTQLNNIISILKNNKDVKVRVAAFADRRGSEDANMEVSKQRAKTIEKLLEEGGVGSQVVKVEGYGDEYAKHSANAPESQRVEDRDIA